ncbi:MAG: dienelactone hydrolase family protein [Aggregatilineales bacterium]
MTMQAQFTDTFRASVLSVLGAPPDLAPLLPEVIEVVPGDGFRREKVKYQVSSGDWAFAYLLIPNKLSAATPTVYVHHRRAESLALGKSEAVGLDGDKNYALALELVQRGYVVFAPDALGFEDRRAPDSSGEDYDREYVFHQLALRLLRGETLLKKVLWDVSRGIDYLETRTEVDSRFLGFVGSGYGGQMALWAAALEPRIRAAVAHGGVLSYRQHFKRGEWLRPEFIVPRLMQVADVQHVLTLIAPRPFLLATTLDDPQSADVQELYEKALPVYTKYGATNRLALYCYMGNGPFSLAMRQSLYTWLDSWLMPY